ncbi:MAG: response regulator transcription factor, partial [Candidatus Latescibacterota bacterium]
SAPSRGARRRLVAWGGAAVEPAPPPDAPPAPICQPESRRLRVLLVDDHAVLRQGLSALLDLEADLQVVGTACSGREAVGQARQLRPDVILMDLNMPEMDGVEATRLIHGELPEIRIIGLSMYREEDRGAAMRHAGAAAYVAKSSQTEALLAAIRAVQEAGNVPRS